MHIFSSLQVRVKLLFLLLSLVPLVLLSILSLRIAQAIITAQVTNQLDNLASDKASLLGRWLGEREADLQAMAETISWNGLSPGAVDPFVETIKKHYKVYETIWVLDQAGKAVSGQGCQPPGCRDEFWFQECLAGRPFRSRRRCCLRTAEARYSGSPFRFVTAAAP